MARLRYSTPPRSRLRRVLDWALMLLVLAGLLFVAARLNPREPGPAGAKVVVNDGDSLTIAGTRVRLWGIDAPELSQTCTRSQGAYPCGRAARDNLRAMVAGGAVECSNEGQDRYGRVLGVCKAGERELNAGQVRAGWAVAYGGYVAEEGAARADKRGVWSGDFERPNVWRREHTQQDTGVHPPRRDDPVAAFGDWLRSLLAQLW